MFAVCAPLPVSVFPLWAGGGSFWRYLANIRVFCSPGNDAEITIKD